MNLTSTSIDRRRVLTCGAIFGVTGPLLVACGSYEESEATGQGPDSGSPSPSEDAEGSAAPEAGASLVATSEVPVGGGVVLPDQGLVVVQPTEGEFKAYPNVCTHQGNLLTGVGGGKITCPVHGAQFAVEDGSNVTGPNGQDGGTVAGLAEVAITVAGDQVTRA